MLDGTYAEKVVLDSEKYLSNKDKFINNMVDNTFSEDVLSDLKEALKETRNLKLISLNPAIICKLLMSALLNKEYDSLPELFSTVDLRGLHYRTKTPKEEEPKKVAVYSPTYAYRSDKNSYEFMLRKLGQWIIRNNPDAEFNARVHTAMSEYTYDKANDPMEYVAALPQDNLCLVDMSTMFTRYMCSQDYARNVNVELPKMCRRINANMTEQSFPNEMTYNLIPVGDAFKNKRIKEVNTQYSAYYWDHKHIPIWHNMLTTYACSMFRRKINQTEQIRAYFEKPFCNGSAYTCYIKKSPNKLHARIFGVYKVSDFYEMLELALEYYLVHPNRNMTVSEINTDVSRLIQIPCVTAHMNLNSVEDCLGFARLYSNLKLW